MLVDTHAHLYLDRFEADRDAVVERARAAGVTRILQPAIDAASVQRALALCERYPGCFAMAALHPSETRDATDADFEAIAAFCDHPRVIAVGESGLDYYWDRSFDEAQHRFLRLHARLAMDRDLPLILHNRDRGQSDECSRDLVRILREERDAHPHGERLRGIFHCFGGPRWLTDEVLAMNFHFGIGGTLTYRNGGVPEAIEEVPLERIVLETDAPFLAPVPHRGQRNEPGYVRLVAERLAELRGLTLEEVARATTENAVRLFGLEA